MRTAIAGALVAFALALAACARADIVYVHPGGAGDYDNIPDAVLKAGPGDTVLVAPGTYQITYAAAPGLGSGGWPIRLTNASPAIMSEAGAAATVLNGGVSLCPFEIPYGTTDARVTIVGFTVRDVPTLIRKWDTADGGVFLIADNVLEDATNGILADGGDGVVSGNRVTGGGLGISAIGFRGSIVGNDVSGCVAVGIGAAPCARSAIEGNHVHACATGIAVESPTLIEGNIVEGCGFVGISITGQGGATALGNVIAGNRVGVSVDYGSGVALHGNDLWGNTWLNVECAAWDAPASVLDATGNWWGTTNAAAIAAGIRDCTDDAGIHCCVVFEPWCDAPGCGATAAAATSWGMLKSLYR
jgi:parallel beta-helix repeat protein